MSMFERAVYPHAKFVIKNWLNYESCNKIFSNQETKDAKDQVTNTQVPIMKLPGRAHPQKGAPRGARSAVDAEAARIEAANVDELAAGRLDGGPVTRSFE